MSGIRVKETMEQIHIPDQMREQIIDNIQNRMEEGRFHEKGASCTRGRFAGSGRSGAWKRRENSGGKESVFWTKRTVAAAAIVLAAGILSVPAQAIVRSFVMARMEEVPEAQVKELTHMLQEQRVEADSFSRELSDSESRRMKELLQSYAVGTFPEKAICLVERQEEMPEGVFCYVFETGYFNLPKREMTDEELLEMIDFNKLRNYVLSQTPAGQEARREQLTEQERLKAQVEAEGGIGREEAVRIAAGQMESQLGAEPEGTIYTYAYYHDISKEDYAHKSDVAYMVVLRSAEGGFPYVCEIDSADGSILKAGENLPYARNILDE